MIKGVIYAFRVKGELIDLIELIRYNEQTGYCTIYSHINDTFYHEVYDMLRGFPEASKTELVLYSKSKEVVAQKYNDFIQPNKYHHPWLRDSEFTRRIYGRFGKFEE